MLEPCGPMPSVLSCKSCRGRQCVALHHKGGKKKRKKREREGKKERERERGKKEREREREKKRERERGKKERGGKKKRKKNILKLQCLYILTTVFQEFVCPCCIRSCVPLMHKS